MQKVNKVVSFNLIKHKVFDLLYNDEPIDEMLEQMEKLFLTNTLFLDPIDHPNQGLIRMLKSPLLLPIQFTI